MYKALKRLLSSLKVNPKFSAARVKDYIDKFSDEKIEKEIIPLLAQLEPSEKVEVIESLDENSFIDKQISVLMANASIEKKLKAIEILVTIGHDKGFIAMIPALKDTREEVKWALTEALKNCQSPQLILPKLIDALKNPNLWVPARISEICVHFGDVTIPYLAKELKKDNCEYKGILIDILGELKSEPAIKELKTLMRYLKNDAELLAKTISAIGKVRSEAGIQIVLDGLQDKDLRVKLASIQALANQNRKHYGRHLLPLLACEDALVRMKAGQALKILGWKVASEYLRTISQKKYDFEELNRVINKVRDTNLVG